MNNKWLTCYKPNPQAKVRLICFPYAGGSASVFHSWLQWLPEWVELHAVQLPGRAERMAEPNIKNMKDYIQGIRSELVALTDKPYALFGHSMGALAAFETSVMLHEAKLPQPEHCLFSAALSPHRQNRMKPISDLPQQAFVEELKKLNGTPEQVFNTPGLLDFCLPYIRADFSVVEQFTTEFSGQLPCKSTVIYGSEDKMNGNDMQEWQSFFTQEVDIKEFTGGHFFIHYKDNVMKVIEELLTRLKHLPSCSTKENAGVTSDCFFP
ncbi:MAG TPA: thioesterase [Vibrio sp.]|uniref:Thioesterase n=1 Tax=Vibrio casei TaxID=673372 RepID=A0A368LFP5_9VIBR|nr:MULTISPECIES: thioesterase domain-containing protein [Vibrio]RCS68617.1 thioesterase [Vibrio casei]SJN30636.1 Thioesterase [Vibrio casei]HCH00620.1 thioesterase [Vibrio sp.]